MAQKTTVDLDDDVFDMVKRYAEARSMALGKALSELVRRGCEPPVKTRRVNGLVVFDSPDDAERVTTEYVKRLEAESC
jgi:hypothetical protein